MQRWKKHLWTGSLLSLSVLLIVAAVAMGVVRLIDLAAPKYRDELSNKLSEALDLPVTIGGMGMSWQAFRPSFELDEVIILDDQRRPVLQVGHVDLPFKWGSLLKGELFPYLVELNDFALVLEWRADGTIGISGVDAGPESGELDLAEVFEYLDKINRIEIKNGVIVWNDFGAQIGLNRIEQVNAALTKTAAGIQVDVDGRFPRHLGERFQVEARFEGPMSKPDELKIVTQFSTDSLYADGWLAPVLDETAALRGGPVKVQFASHWRGLNFQKAAMRIAASPLNNVGQPEVVELPGMNAELKITPLGDGWDMDLVSLQYLYENSKSAVSRGNIRYQPTPDGFGTRLDAELDSIALRDLTAWLSVLDVLAEHPLPVGPEVSGQLLNTRFEFQQLIGDEPSFELQSMLKKLAVPATEAVPGFSGFDGQLFATQDAGRVTLNASQGALDIPAVFATALPLNKFNTELHWEQQDNAWQLRSKQLALGVESLTASGELELLIDGAATPLIDLVLDFKASDIAVLKPFIPLPPALPEDVGNWLQASLGTGKVPTGKFQLRGRLGDFPFEGMPAEKGLFKIAFKAVDTHLAYAEGWPAVENITGDAVFQGRSMRVDASKGQIVGVPISKTVARIPDFLKPVLIVNGEVQADIGKQLAFLPASPLREDYQALLEAISIKGPGHLNLELNMPLQDVSSAKISGHVELQGAELQYTGLPEPVTDIRGGLSFSGDGLAAERLNGKLLGLPVQAQLTPALGGQGKTDLSARAQIQLPQQAANLQGYLASELLENLSGQTQLQLNTRFDNSASASALRISSDLQGMQIKLGKPFGKTAAEQRAIELSVVPGNTQTDVQWRFADSLQGQLRYRAKSPDGSLELNRGRIRFGQKKLQDWPTTAALYIEGELPELDLNGLKIAADVPPAAWPPVYVDAQFGHLKFAEQHFKDIRLVSGEVETGVISPRQGTLRVKSGQATGRLSWNTGASGRLMVNGDFDNLYLKVPQPSTPQATDSDAESEAPPIDPKDLPVISLQVKTFRLGDEGLGSLKLDTQAIDSGLRIALLEIGGRRIEVRGGGEWTRIKGKSSARLVMNINGNDIVGLLNATGYAPSITAEQADIFAELDWAPDSAGLDLANLNGKMSFDLIDGSLLEVKPGAGRVLSLLSFYSLPRRLTLDFRDVLGKGTAFDKLTGDFAIVDGNATTEDLEVIMPSARIEVRGRVGLAAKDYDQVVTIYPGISSSVALAGAVLGGPVLGIGLWIAQEFLDKPFDQVAQLSYRLKGSWDEPVVEGLSAKERSQTTPQQTAPSAAKSKKNQPEPLSEPAAPEQGDSTKKIGGRP